jgi:very-short-patch-repair endonuclease
MSTEAKIAFLRTAYVHRWAQEFDAMMQLYCESPIERLFLGQMLVDGWWYPASRDHYEIRQILQVRYGIESTYRILQIDDVDGFVVVQANVSPGGKKYRLDIAFVSEQGRIAVELDGHDFHEKTKEQARRDKSRDRALTKDGWRVLRFAGSEVYADPAGCIQQVREMSQALQAESARSSHVETASIQ